MPVSGALLVMVFALAMLSRRPTISEINWKVVAGYLIFEYSITMPWEGQQKTIFDLATSQKRYYSWAAEETRWLVASAQS